MIFLVDFSRLSFRQVQCMVWSWFLSNCATGAWQFNEGLRRREIYVIKFIEAFQLFDPGFIRMEISVNELKQCWEREESGEKLSHCVLENRACPDLAKPCEQVEMPSVFG